MSIELTIIIASASAIISALISWLWTHLRSQQRIAKLNIQLAEVNTQLKIEKESLARQDKDKGLMTSIFNDLSSQALQNNNDTFLKLAQEKLKQFQIKAENNLSDKEKAIEQLLKPVKVALEKTEHQIREIEKDRKHSFGELSQQIKFLAQAQDSLQGETRNLVTALRRPEVRGKWGELTLKRVVELAGMVEHCDFFEQETIGDKALRLRPDMIVRLPNERQIIVDAKTPLDAYLNAIETLDEKQKQLELERHARNVKERVKELASKTYWNNLDKTPDFVVMFIPGEQFLSAALEIDRTLLEYGLNQKIIISTPTTLVALLRAVAYGWRHQSLEKNAEKVRELGESLYKRLSVFTSHLSKLGDKLSSSVEHFNQTVGSLERQVLPAAKKMEELGIETKKKIETPEPIDKSLRSLSKPNNMDS